MRRLLLALGLFCAALSGGALAREASVDSIARAELPDETQQTLQLIRRGGPFPYRRDGIAFGKFEGHLPPRARGYYREYTVPTRGNRDRGARRIITGRAGEAFYSSDHYRSFRRIRE